MNSPALVSVPRTTGGTIGIADVCNMWARLIPGSHKNAVWVVNADSLPTLYQMTVTTGTASGQSVFLPGGTISGIPFSTLLGRPLIVSEVGSSLATAGALILADFSSYALATKGTRIDTSIHCQFLTDQTCFRAVTRLDGQSLLSNSVIPFKGANSLSAFISLAA
jgi:HK97 family phage major capsid protein